jgi:putative membrane protein
VATNRGRAWYAWLSDWPLFQEIKLSHAYWNDWYFGWGWFLWFGIIFLFFSSVGNWGYSYRAHRRFGELTGRDASDILNERYARGEITHEELGFMKSKISKG